LYYDTEQFALEKSRHLELLRISSSAGHPKLVTDQLSTVRSLSSAVLQGRHILTLYLHCFHTAHICDCQATPVCCCKNVCVKQILLLHAGECAQEDSCCKQASGHPYLLLQECLCKTDSVVASRRGRTRVRGARRHDHREAGQLEGRRLTASIGHVLGEAIVSATLGVLEVGSGGAATRENAEIRARPKAAHTGSHILAGYDDVSDAVDVTRVPDGACDVGFGGWACSSMPHRSISIGTSGLCGLAVLMPRHSKCALCFKTVAGFLHAGCTETC
jgi:hypothetical protein